MIRKVVNFFLPICEAKRAEKLIKEKQECLKKLDKCKEELKQKLEKEINKLPKNLQELEKLLEKESERKKVIENKSNSLFIVVSLLGITFTFFYRIIETVTNTIFLYSLSLLIFGELIYLTLSISSLLYILVEINIIYEPLLHSLKELEKHILLNRYQNITRTNYLSTVFSNIKRFFWLLLLTFTIFLSLKLQIFSKLFQIFSKLFSLLKCFIYYSLHF